MKKFAMLLVSIICIGLLAGCGGQEVVELEVRMTDFAYTPSTLNFPAGAEVRLTLINDGALEHEMLIGRNAGEGYEVDLFDRDPSKVEASGTEGFHVGSAEEIEEEGYHVELEPGASGTLVFTVPPEKAGEWEMGCFLDEGTHYEQGMHGPVEITAP
jgi:uncharacterized cupredoxin-like copper-binding protein